MPTDVVQPSAPSTPTEQPAATSPTCPKCGGHMWDNRATKRNPKAPDFKCRDRACGGVLWPNDHRRPMALVDRPSEARMRARTLIAPSDAGAAVQVERAIASATASAPLDSDRSDERRHQLERERLQRCYLALSDFVLAAVRPRYQEAGIPFDGATAASISATLFIATSRSGAA